jgi:hypothetical protein
VAPYHPPPSYPPPQIGAIQKLDNRALVALGLAITGLVLGLLLGVPGLICGPIAYFLGKSAINRIDASAGTLGGRGIATAAWIFGIVATVVGAIISLVLLVLLLVQISGPPPQ